MGATQLLKTILKCLVAVRIEIEPDLDSFLLNFVTQKYTRSLGYNRKSFSRFQKEGGTFEQRLGLAVRAALNPKCVSEDTWQSIVTDRLMTNAVDHLIAMREKMDLIMRELQMAMTAWNAYAPTSLKSAHQSFSKANIETWLRQHTDLIPVPLLSADRLADALREGGLFIRQGEASSFSEVSLIAPGFHDVKTVELIWCTNPAHKRHQTCHCPLQKVVRAETCLRLPWTTGQTGPRVCQIKSSTVPYFALIFVYRESQSHRTSSTAVDDDRRTSKRKRRSSPVAQEWEQCSEAIVTRSTKKLRVCHQPPSDPSFKRSDTSLTRWSTAEEEPEWPTLVEDLLARPGPVLHTRVHNAFSSPAFAGGAGTSGRLGATEPDNRAGNSIAPCEHESSVCDGGHVGGASVRKCLE